MKLTIEQISELRIREYKRHDDRIKHLDILQISLQEICEHPKNKLHEFDDWYEEDEYKFRCELCGAYLYSDYSRYHYDLDN